MPVQYFWIILILIYITYVEICKLTSSEVTVSVLFCKIASVFLVPSPPLSALLVISYLIYKRKDDIDEVCACVSVLPVITLFLFTISLIISHVSLLEKYKSQSSKNNSNSSNSSTVKSLEKWKDGLCLTGQLWCCSVKQIKPSRIKMVA